MTALSIKDDFVVLLPASLLLERLFGYGAKGNSPPPLETHLQSPALRLIPLLPYCQHSCLYPAKYCFWLEAGGNGGWKHQPTPLPKALACLFLHSVPYNHRGQKEWQGAASAFFFKLLVSLLWSPCPKLPGIIAPAWLWGPALPVVTNKWSPRAPLPAPCQPAAGTPFILSLSLLHISRLLPEGAKRQKITGCLLWCS